MIQPTARPLVSGLPAPSVASPYRAPAVSDLAAGGGDGVTISSPGSPPPPTAAEAAAAEVTSAPSVGLGAMVVAAAMAGLAVAGSLAPGLGPVVAATTVSQAQAQAPLPQDPKALVTTLASTAEASAQALPQVNKVHGQWKADAASMQATVDGVAGHVDAILRAPKGKDLATHQKAVDEGLARLGGQLQGFQGRLGQEGPVVDEFLGRNRDNLDQVGTMTWNLKGSVDTAASGYGYFSPQRQALRDLSGSFQQASRHVAVATERTTTSRQEDKTLRQTVETLQKSVAEVQKLAEKARTDPKAVAKVDEGVRALQKAVSLAGQLIGQSEKDVAEASAFSHRGALDLGAALPKLQALTGGSPGSSTPQP